MKYLKKVKEEEKKRIVVGGLVTFKEFCDRHSLRYYLAFGTLIGAVRHKGFIPWDDDIDVIMPRADYEKLRSLTDEVRTDDWELLSYSSEPRFLFPYMKYCHRKTAIVPSRFASGFIYGASIDIFPLDYLDGESPEAVRLAMKPIRDQVKKAENDTHKVGEIHPGLKSALKRTAKVLLYHVKPSGFERLRAMYAEIDRRMLQISQDGGKYAAYILNSYLYDSVHPATVWEKADFCGEEDSFSILTFEGHTFTAPYNYDAVLRKTYGDYMQLPPEEERVSRHTYTAWYISR